MGSNIWVKRPRGGKWAKAHHGVKLGWAGSVGLGINKLLGRIWDVCDVFIYIPIDNNKFI